MKNKAFTLIELLVVVAVISLLSSIIYSATSEAKDKAKDAVARQNVESIKQAVGLYKDQNGLFPLASGASTGEIYSLNDPDDDYFEESMQILVDEGYLSAVVGYDGIEYTYGVSEDGESAVVGAGLNNSYVGSDTKNNCDIPFSNGGGGDAGPEDPCYSVGRYPGTCDAPPPAWTGYVFPPTAHPEATYCVNVRVSADITYGCGCSGGTMNAVDNPSGTEWVTNGVCANYFTPGTCNMILNFPPPSGSDFYACTPAEGESMEGICDGSNDSDYCGCIN